MKLQRLCLILALQSEPISFKPVFFFQNANRQKVVTPFIDICDAKKVSLTSQKKILFLP